MKNKNAFISTFCNDIKARKTYKMPQTGFEPVHGNPYNDLNVARLPIPPLGHRYLAVVYQTTILIILINHQNAILFPDFFQKGY